MKVAVIFLLSALALLSLAGNTFSAKVTGKEASCHDALEICWTRRRDMAVSFRGLSLSAHSEGLSEVDKNSGEPENTYILRPIFQQRFRPSVVKDCIHTVLKEELASAEYSPDEMPQLTKRLSEMIKDKLKELGYDRYKMVVQVVIGEQRGEGVLVSL